MEEKLLEKLALREALRHLGEKERLVIQLRYYHSLTQQRVSEIIGVSQVQVSRIEKKALRIPPIFPLLSRMGGISERDMFNTFNMGTGMVLVAAKDSADKALAALHSLGQEAGVIGEIVLGEEKVELC